MDLEKQMAIETVEYHNIKYAEIIWAGTSVEKTTFFSSAVSFFQFGLLAHSDGFVEPPHYHKPLPRTVTDLQQMFIVQQGVIVVELYSDVGELLREIEMHVGDAIVLIHGPHAIRVIEDMQCISVKQGPYLGEEQDKVFLDAKQ